MIYGFTIKNIKMVQTNLDMGGVGGEKKETKQVRNTKEDFKQYFKNLEIYEQARLWNENDVFEGEIIGCEIREMDETDKIVMKVKGENTTKLFVLNKTNERICRKYLRGQDLDERDFTNLIGRRVKFCVIQMPFKGDVVNSFRLLFV